MACQGNAAVLETWAWPRGSRSSWHLLHVMGGGAGWCKHAEVSPAGPILQFPLTCLSTALHHHHCREGPCSCDPLPALTLSFDAQH